MNMNSQDYARLARERAAFHYTGALERGDLDMLSKILREAEDDPVLARIIEEINLVYSASDEAEQLRPSAMKRPVSLAHHGYPKGMARASTPAAVRNLHASPRLQQPRVSLASMMLSAAGLVFLLLGGIALFLQGNPHFTPGAFAQNTPSATATASPPPTSTAIPSPTYTPTIDFSPTALPRTVGTGTPNVPPTPLPYVVLTVQPMDGTANPGLIVPISPPQLPGTGALAGSSIVVMPPNASPEQVRELVLKAVEEALQHSAALPIQIQISRPDGVQNIMVFSSEAVQVVPGASPTPLPTPTVTR